MLARGAVVAALLFTSGWVAGAWVQDARYSVARDDISDLGAMTAMHPWVMLVPQGISGVLVLAFALGALEPALRRNGERASLGAWLVALSVMGLDNLSDPFFRLDRRAADAARAAALAPSWHASLHLAVGALTFVTTIAACVVLARRMRELPQWRDLAAPTAWFGAVFAIVLAVYVLRYGAYGQGYTQRALELMSAGGVAVLALRVLRIEHAAGSPVP